MPKHQYLGRYRPVAAEQHYHQAEYPAGQRVDDVEQHPAQPTMTVSRLQATVQVSRSIEYSSGTGLSGCPVPQTGMITAAALTSAHFPPPAPPCRPNAA
jgi:hypothetical protein